MEILLIRPNDQKNVYGATNKYTACEPPYWAMMLAAFLREHHHDVGILDAEAENMSPDDVAEKVTELSPTLIGMIVTGTNLSASTWKMLGARAASQAIKDSGYEGKIFFWGLHPSALPEETLMEEPTDFVVKGESFNTVLGLLEILGQDTIARGGGVQRHSPRSKDSTTWRTANQKATRS